MADADGWHRALPDDDDECRHVVNLDLSRQGLTGMPPRIGLCTALQELWLSDNRLTSVPAELGQCTALQTLSLRDNRLTSVPAELGQCTALQQFDLYGNPLSEDTPTTPAGLQTRWQRELAARRAQMQQSLLEWNPGGAPIHRFPSAVAALCASYL